MFPLEVITVQVSVMSFVAPAIFVIDFFEALLLYGSFKLIDSHPKVARLLLFLMLILPLFLLFFVI